MLIIKKQTYAHHYKQFLQSPRCSGNVEWQNLLQKTKFTKHKINQIVYTLFKHDIKVLIKILIWGKHKKSALIAEKNRSFWNFTGAFFMLLFII